MGIPSTTHGQTFWAYINRPSVFDMSGHDNSLSTLKTQRDLKGKNSELVAEKNVYTKLRNVTRGKYGIVKYVGTGAYGKVFEAIDFVRVRALFEKRLAAVDASTAQQTQMLDVLKAEHAHKKKEGTFHRKDARARQIDAESKEIIAEKKRLAAARKALYRQTEWPECTVAVKSINLYEYKQTAKEVDREVEVMRKLHHDNIVCVYEYFKPVSWRFIVMEFCNRGNVDELILNMNGQLTVSMVKDFARSTLSALRYLHEQNLVHNDVKPENIMVHKTSSGQYVYKLADFGSAEFCQRPYESTVKSIAGTFDYFSPEKMTISPEKMTMSYNAKADIYALGVSLYRLLTGRHTMAKPPETSAPILRQLRKHPLMNDPKALLDFYSQDGARCDDGAQDLLWKMTMFNAEARPTAEALGHHPWLKHTDVVDDVTEYVRKNLVKYAGLAQMQKIVRRNIKGMLPQTDIDAMRTIFQYVTRHYFVTRQYLIVLQGKITVQDMQTFMADLDVNVDASALDIDSDGLVDVDEFITAVLAPWIWKTDYRSDELFEAVDNNTDGTIDADEFMRSVLARGLTTSDAERLFRRIDTNGDTKLTKGEFRQWVHLRESTKSTKSTK